MDTNAATLAEEMGARIRQARLQAELTPDDVARALGITTNNFIAAENGGLKLCAGHVADLCDLFNKRPSWFFGM